MVQRSRSRAVQVLNGSKKTYSSSGSLLSTSTSSVSQTESIVDEVKVGDNGILTIKKPLTFIPHTINGYIPHKSSPPAMGHLYDNFAPQGYTGMAVPHLTPPAVSGDKGNGAYMAKLLADTNPSRSIVDLPIFIAEMRELPDLVKKLGLNLKGIAQANLRYQFGWKPLLSDLSKLLDFQQHVNNRYWELKKLNERGLRYTRTLDQLSGTSSTSFNSQGSGYSIQGTSKVNHQMTVRGHVRWKSTLTGPVTDQRLHQLARQAVFGLTVDFATAWELIPFSWLVDWYSSVGDFLIAQRNTVGAVPTHMSIMRESVIEGSVTEPSNFSVNSALTVKLPHGKWEQKTRTPTSASITAYLPYLSMRQLSILGSLYVLKTR